MREAGTYLQLLKVSALPKASSKTFKDRYGHPYSNFVVAKGLPLQKQHPFLNKSVSEVDAGLERHDLLQLLRDIAVWESMPMHELKQEIAKSTGPAVCDRGLQPGAAYPCWVWLDDAMYTTCSHCSGRLGRVPTALPAGRAAALATLCWVLWRQRDPCKTPGIPKSCCELGKGPMAGLQYWNILEPASLTPRGSERHVIVVSSPETVDGTRPQELADLDRQESSSLKSECRRLGVPAEHLRQQAWQGRFIARWAELIWTGAATYIDIFDPHASISNTTRSDIQYILNIL